MWTKSNYYWMLSVSLISFNSNLFPLVYFLGTNIINVMLMTCHITGFWLCFSWGCTLKKSQFCYPPRPKCKCRCQGIWEISAEMLYLRLLIYTADFLKAAHWWYPHIQEHTCIHVFKFVVHGWYEITCLFFSLLCCEIFNYTTWHRNQTTYR